MAESAARSGVADRPIEDLDAYRQSLTRYITHTGMFMRPVFTAARASEARWSTPKARWRRVRAAQVVVDDGLARPILIGRPEVIAQRVARAGLRLRLGEDVQVVDLSDARSTMRHWRDYHAVMGRHGMTPDMARTTLQRSRTAGRAMMVRAAMPTR